MEDAYVVVQDGSFEQLAAGVNKLALKGYEPLGVIMVIWDDLHAQPWAYQAMWRKPAKGGD